MLKQEWKNIFHNTWIKVVLIAIVLIPSIYACVFLGSMWDPYGHSGDLPVAVVNHDQEVDYGGKTLSIGQELVDNLKENKSLDFHFVSASKAQEGLEKGNYYMVITIPQEFSKNATTLLDDDPQKMVLHYTTNPGTNYVASKMDDSAIAKIKEEVASSVTKTYAETLLTSVSTLSNGLSQASDGTSQLLDGMNQLTTGNQTISDHLKVLASSTLTFQDGSQTLTKGVTDYTDGVVTVHNGVYSLKQGLNTLDHSTTTLTSGVEQLNNGASTLNQGLNQYVNGVAQASQGTNTLVKNNDVLNAGVESLQKGVEQVQGVNSQLTQGLMTLSQELESQIPSDDKMAQLDDIQNSVSSLTTFAKSSLQYNQKAEALVTSLKNSGGLSEEDAEVLLTALKTSDGVNSAVVGNSTQANPGLSGITQTLVDGQKQAINGLKSVNNALNKKAQNPSTEPNQVGLIQASQVVTSGLKEVNQGLVQSQKGLKEYTTGVSNVNNGLHALVDKNAVLLNGGQSLSQGLATMKESTPALVTGVQQLSDGANQLYQGTSELTTHNASLTKGALELSNGAKLISDGASQLAEGSLTLGQGVADAKEGTVTLNNALEEGVQKSKISFSDKTTDMMSAPLDVNHQEISKVENNGHAMAPYMMSVALYVAGLAFTLMYPIRNGIKGVKNGLKYWLSKATVMYSISTISAIVMVSALRYFNGFEPENLLLTYGFAILVSAAFMSLIMFVSLTTGYIGEFLLLVFMIFNLGGSAGTYPLDTSSAIYKMIHPFVPYTYSVDGFRKVISMHAPALTMEIGVLIGLLVICSLLTILYYQYKNKEDHHLIPQSFEKVNE